MQQLSLCHLCSCGKNFSYNDIVVIFVSYSGTLCKVGSGRMQQFSSPTQHTGFSSYTAEARVLCWATITAEASVLGWATALLQGVCYLRILKDYTIFESALFCS